MSDVFILLLLAWKLWQWLLGVVTSSFSWSSTKYAMNIFILQKSNERVSTKWKGLVCGDEPTDNYHPNLQFHSVWQSFIAHFSSLFSCSICNSTVFGSGFQRTNLKFFKNQFCWCLITKERYTFVRAKEVKLNVNIVNKRTPDKLQFFCIWQDDVAIFNPVHETLDFSTQPGEMAINLYNTRPIFSGQLYN